MNNNDNWNELNILCDGGNRHFPTSMIFERKGKGLRRGAIYRCSICNSRKFVWRTVIMSNIKWKWKNVPAKDLLDDSANDNKNTIIKQPQNSLSHKKEPKEESGDDLLKQLQDSGSSIAENSVSILVKESKAKDLYLYDNEITKLTNIENLRRVDLADVSKNGVFWLEDSEPIRRPSVLNNEDLQRRARKFYRRLSFSEKQELALEIGMFSVCILIAIGISIISNFNLNTFESTAPIKSFFILALMALPFGISFWVTSAVSAFYKREAYSMVEYHFSSEPSLLGVLLDEIDEYNKLVKELEVIEQLEGVSNSKIIENKTKIVAIFKNIKDFLVRTLKAEAILRMNPNFQTKSLSIIPTSPFEGLEQIDISDEHKKSVDRKLSQKFLSVTKILYL